ncbi:hypothetical protein PGB90_002604 [Kerria lacca]
MGRKASTLEEKLKRSEYIRDCPKEPHIPVYMVVGGCFGLMKILCVLWGQIRSLRYERLNPRDTTRAESEEMLPTSVGTKIGCFALNTFLVVWFFFGNYWILHIYWPDQEPTLFKPDNWCHRTFEQMKNEVEERKKMENKLLNIT